MFFAVFTAKTAVFSRRMKFDGVLHLAFMHLQHPQLSCSFRLRCLFLIRCGWGAWIFALIKGVIMLDLGIIGKQLGIGEQD